MKRKRIRVKSYEEFFSHMTDIPDAGTVCDDYMHFGTTNSGMLGGHLPILDTGLCRHQEERRLLAVLNS